MIMLSKGEVEMVFIINVVANVSCFVAGPKKQSKPDLMIFFFAYQ